MEVQDNMKERLLTMCQRMARRKSAGQKKRTLLQLSEMLGTLGYRTTLIGKKGIHGQQLIGGDPEHARLIVAADFNLREARMIPGRQRLLDQSANRKNQLDNLTVTLVLSVLLAVMGVLLCIAGTKEAGRWYLFLMAALVFLFAFGLGRRQAVGNAGKNAALFAMLECARTYRNRPIAFCFLEETGTELGLQQLREHFPQARLVYLNQLGREKALCVILKGKEAKLREHCAQGWPEITVQAAEEPDDSLIRSWNSGILISTADPASMTCEMPGGKFDVQMDSDQIRQAVSLIGGLIQPENNAADPSSV